MLSIIFGFPLVLNSFVVPLLPLEPTAYYVFKNCWLNSMGYIHSAVILYRYSFHEILTNLSQRFVTTLYNIMVSDS